MQDARYKTGSALILTVVLTSLLAIIGVMFVMIARVNKMATSGISENKELNSAVEAVVAKISQELVLDVPGMPKGGEYYDYPGDGDKWLASLEPYNSGGYKWRQISDVTGFLADKNYDTNNVAVNPPGSGSWIKDYPKITLDTNGELDDLWADADGDGAADSKWIELEGITSNKGKPIYAAIRIVDNGGMLNANTAYKFDPNDGRERINGANQAQINLAALKRGTTKPFSNLHDMRKGGETWDLDKYINDVVWQIEQPAGLWTPFDISDELKLRNRYIISKTSVNTRIGALWTKAFDWEPYVPRNERDHSINHPNDWFWYVNNSSTDTNDYNYRHIATIYNMDRIINPFGGKMVNINDPDVSASSLYTAIRAGIYDYDPNFADINDVAAQMTVNLIDFRDNDSNVTYATDSYTGYTYYGFERPCAYISELSHVFKEDPNVPGRIYRSYAIELYKPYFEDNDPCDWQLVIDGASYDIDWSEGSRRFYVMRWEDPCVPTYLIPVLVPVGDFNDPNDPNDPNDYGYDPNDYGYGAVIVDFNSTMIFKGGDLIKLQRPAPSAPGGYITVDSEPVPLANNGWLEDVDGTAHSVQRDITRHKCIRRLWSSAGEGNVGDSPTLGQHNDYIDPDSRMIQAHPANEDFTNIGEIGMLFHECAYGTNGIGYKPDKDEEEEVRVDLTELDYQQLFKYLTVSTFDPTTDGIDNDGDGWTDESTLAQTPEWKIPGRININTAPWYVIAQLPWMMPDIAQKIVERRDTTIRGFESIGELMRVDEMGYYADDSVDLTGFPDLTPGTSGDGAKDDFEERDVIFARISNLITVRSDVFTAYILVRIGTDGPQKRAIAILDRSDVYPLDGGKVKIITLHPVPDPR